MPNNPSIPTQNSSLAPKSGNRRNRRPRNDRAASSAEASSTPSRPSPSPKTTSGRSENTITVLGPIVEVPAPPHKRFSPRQPVRASSAAEVAAPSPPSHSSRSKSPAAPFERTMNKISTLLEASASTPNPPSQPQTTRASPIAEVDPTHIRNPSPNTTSIPPERIINVLSPLVEVPAPPLKPPSAHQTAAKPSSAEVAAAPSGSSSSTTATQPKTTATSSTRAPTEALPQVPFTSFASVIAALRAGTLSSSLFEAELDELVKERVARIVTALTRIDKEDDRRRFILTQLAQTIPTIGSADETKDVLFAWRRWYELARLSFELDSHENDGPAIGAPRWTDNYCWQAFNIALRNSCNVDFHAFAEIAKFRNFVDVLRFAEEFDHPRKTPPPPRILSAITKMAAEHSWEGTPDADDYGSITACFLYGQKVVDIVTEDTSGIVWASTEQACLKLAWEAVPADWQALVLKQGDPKSFLDSSDLFADAFNAVTWDMEVKERLRQEEIRLRGRKTFKLSDPDFDEIFGKEGLVLDCERAAVEMGFLAKRW